MACKNTPTKVEQVTNNANSAHGTSLFIGNQASESSLDLGIQAPSKGIEHFTNYEGLTSLELTSQERFDSRGATKFLGVEFGANAIKIEEDVAAVAYGEYTDINKMVADETWTSFSKIAGGSMYRTASKHIINGTYAGDTTPYVWQLPMFDRGAFDKIGDARIPGEKDARYSDYKDNYFHNMFIIIEYNGTAWGLGELDDPSTDIADGYSVFAGQKQVFRYHDGDESTATEGTFFWGDNDSLQIKICNEKTAGKQLLTGMPNIEWYGWNTNSSSALRTIFRENLDGASHPQVYTYAKLDIRSIQVVKYTPVVGCGKVDLYTRKTGIITALGELGQATAPSHGINSGDILKISTALTPAGSNDLVDHNHEINGTRYAEAIDSDTIRLYVDSDMSEEAPTTTPLRGDCVWTVIGNVFSGDSQGWSYYQSLCSPNGRNGYTSRDLFTLDSHNNPTPTLATSDQFLFDKINDVFNDDNYTHDGDSKWKWLLETDLQAADSDTDVTEQMYRLPVPMFVDDDLERQINSFDLENSCLASRAVPSTLDALWKHPRNFFPHPSCSDDGKLYFDLKNFPHFPLNKGYRFGCAIDLIKEKKEGSSTVYKLLVGERGASKVPNYQDMRRSGMESNIVVPGGPAGANAYEVWREADTNAGAGGGFEPPNDSWNAKAVPTGGAYGKSYLFEIKVDQYKRISEINHSNTYNASSFTERSTPENWVCAPQEFYTEENGDDYTDSKFFARQSNHFCNKYKNYYKFEGVKNSLKIGSTTYTADQFENVGSTFADVTGYGSVIGRLDMVYWRQSLVYHWGYEEGYKYSIDLEDRIKERDATVKHLDVYCDAGRADNKTNNRLFADLMLPYYTFDTLKYRSLGSRLYKDETLFYNPNITGRVPEGWDASSRRDYYDSLWNGNRLHDLYPFVDSFGKAVALDLIDGTVIVSASSKSKLYFEINDVVAYQRDIAKATAVGDHKHFLDNLLYVQTKYTTSDGALIKPDNGWQSKKPRLAGTQVGYVRSSILDSAQDVSLNQGRMIWSGNGHITGVWAGCFRSQYHKAEKSAICIIAEDSQLLWGESYAPQFIKDNPGPASLTGIGQMTSRIYTQSGDGYSERTTLENHKSFENDSFQYPCDVATDKKEAYLKDLSLPYHETKYYIYPSDRFGDHFKYNDGQIAVNSYCVRNEFEQLHPDVAQDSLGLYSADLLVDYLQVYQFNGVGWVYASKISASLDSTKGSYAYQKSLDVAVGSTLRSLGNINYSNHLIRSKTWDIDLTNRFEWADDKLVLKDPVGYCVFERSDSPMEEEGIQTSLIECPDYLTFQENFTCPRQLKGWGGIPANYPTPTVTYNYDGVLDSSGPAVTIYQGDADTQHRAGVVFFRIPIPTDKLSTLEDLRINFKYQSSQDIFRAMESPLVILYKSDPRTTIYPYYLKYPQSDRSDNTYLTSSFRGGAQDSHFYRENSFFNGKDKFYLTDNEYGQGMFGGVHYIAKAFKPEMSSTPTTLIDHTYHGRLLISKAEIFDFITDAKLTQTGKTRSITEEYGSYNISFDDKNQSSYVSIDDKSHYPSLIVGFVQSNVISAETVDESEDIKLITSDADTKFAIRTPYINDSTDGYHYTAQGTNVGGEGTIEEGGSGDVICESEQGGGEAGSVDTKTDSVWQISHDKIMGHINWELWIDYPEGHPKNTRQAQPRYGLPQGVDTQLKRWTQHMNTDLVGVYNVAAVTYDRDKCGPYVGYGKRMESDWSKKYTNKSVNIFTGDDYDKDSRRSGHQTNQYGNAIGPFKQYDGTYNFTVQDSKYVDLDTQEGFAAIMTDLPLTALELQAKLEELVGEGNVKVYDGFVGPKDGEAYDSAKHDALAYIATDDDVEWWMNMDDPQADPVTGNHNQHAYGFHDKNIHKMRWENDNGTDLPRQPFFNYFIHFTGDLTGLEVRIQTKLKDAWALQYNRYDTTQPFNGSRQGLAFDFRMGNGNLAPFSWVPPTDGRRRWNTPPEPPVPPVVGRPDGEVDEDGRRTWKDTPQLHEEGWNHGAPGRGGGLPRLNQTKPFVGRMAYLGAYKASWYAYPTVKDYNAGTRRDMREWPMEQPSKVSGYDQIDKWVSFPWNYGIARFDIYGIEPKAEEISKGGKAITGGYSTGPDTYMNEIQIVDLANVDRNAPRWGLDLYSDGTGTGDTIIQNGTRGSTTTDSAGCNTHYWIEPWSISKLGGTIDNFSMASSNTCYPNFLKKYINSPDQVVNWMEGNYFPEEFLNGRSSGARNMTGREQVGTTSYQTAGNFWEKLWGDPVDCNNATGDGRVGITKGVHASVLIFARSQPTFNKQTQNVAQFGEFVYWKSPSSNLGTSKEGRGMFFADDNGQTETATTRTSSYGATINLIKSWPQSKAAKDNNWPTTGPEDSYSETAMSNEIQIITPFWYEQSEDSRYFKIHVQLGLAGNPKINYTTEWIPEDARTDVVKHALLKLPPLAPYSGSHPDPLKVEFAGPYGYTRGFRRPNAYSYRVTFPADFGDIPPDGTSTSDCGEVGFLSLGAVYTKRKTNVPYVNSKNLNWNAGGNIADTTILLGTVNEVRITAVTKTVPNVRRYPCVFAKKANFSYDKSNNIYDRGPFTDKLSPDNIAALTAEEKKDMGWSHKDRRLKYSNPILGIGPSTAASVIDKSTGELRGTISDSYQMLSLDTLYTTKPDAVKYKHNRGKGTLSNNFLAWKAEKPLQFRGSLNYQYLTSLDIQRNEFLPLFMKGFPAPTTGPTFPSDPPTDPPTTPTNPFPYDPTVPSQPVVGGAKDEFLKLFIQGAIPFNGSTTLHASGIAGDNTSMRLRMGAPTFDSDPHSLKLSFKETAAYDSYEAELVLYNLQPSAVMPLAIGASGETLKTTLHATGPSGLNTQLDDPAQPNYGTTLSVKPPVLLSNTNRLVIPSGYGISTSPTCDYPHLLIQGAELDNNSSTTMYFCNNHVESQLDDPTQPNYGTTLSVQPPRTDANTLSLFTPQVNCSGWLSLYTKTKFVENAGSGTLYMPVAGLGPGGTTGAGGSAIIGPASNVTTLAVSGPSGLAGSGTLFVSYNPSYANNIDDSLDGACVISYKGEKFDMSPHAEPKIKNTNTNSIVLREYNNTFKDMENGYVLIPEIGADIITRKEDGDYKFYYNNRINESVDNNEDYLCVAVNTSIEQNNTAIEIFDIDSQNKVNLAYSYTTLKNDLISASLLSGDRAILKAYYKNLKISSGNRIAASIGLVTVDRSTLRTEKKYENIIFVLEKGSSNTWSFVAGFGNSCSNISERLTQEIGLSVEWDGEDLYYSQESLNNGKINYRLQSETYAVPRQATSFESTDVFDKYDNNIDSGNLEQSKLGFGHKIIISGDLMFVACPLFDGYAAKNILTKFDFNAFRGAVFIFTRTGGVWSHIDTIYQGGYTSSTLTSTSYECSYTAKLFGYDIAYSSRSATLVVGEPLGKQVYGYDVGSDGIAVLSETYIGASDDKDYGAAVDICHRDLVTFSKKSLLASSDVIHWHAGRLHMHSARGEDARTLSGAIYNLTRGTSFNFDVDNPYYEMVPYVEVGHGFKSTTEILSTIRVLHFTNRSALLAGRTFNLKYGNQSTDIRKLSLLDIVGDLNPTLFIKGPLQAESTSPLHIEARQIDTGALSLSLPLRSTGNYMNMFLQPSPVGEMTLNIRTATTGVFPLHLQNWWESGTPNSMNMVMQTLKPTVSETTLHTSGLGLSNAGQPLFLYNGPQFNTFQFFLKQKDPISSDGGTTVAAYGAGGGETLSFTDVNNNSLYPSGLMMSIESTYHTPFANGAPLFLKTSPTGQMTGSSSLYLQESTPATGILNSASGLYPNGFTLNVGGKGWASGSNTAPLYMPAYPANSGDATLVLYRRGTAGGEESEGNMNMFLKRVDIASGMNLVSEGIPGEVGNLSLITGSGTGFTPATGLLYIRGYEV